MRVNNTKKQKSRRTEAKRVHNESKRRVSKRVVPLNSEQFFAKPEEFRERWNRAVGVISRMRAGSVSLSKAAREFAIDPRTVQRLGSSALRKQANGRYTAKRSDRLLRVLSVPTPEGVREIGVRSSRQASQLAKYWVAIQRYLQTGDVSALSRFHGKIVKDASGEQIPLLTSRHELDRLGSAGVLSFESLYAKTA